MRIRIALLAPALLILAGCQQPNGDIADRLIIGEVMMHSEFAENLRGLCLPGGRLSGTANLEKAGQFIAGKLRGYGYARIRFEPFAMTAWQSTQTTVKVLGDPPLVLDSAVALGYTLGTPPDGVTADVVDVGEGRAEDFERIGEALRGKFALSSDNGARRTAKMRLALERGAVGLVVAVQPNQMPYIGMCHPSPQPEPGVVISHDDRQKVAEKLAAGGTVRLNVKVQAEAWDARPSNLVAEIPGVGRNRREIVILCAHLDSWHLAEGAIDNGNGSAAILETARALAAVGWKPDRTVRFTWFAGEEQGLFGSKAYVAAHADELPRTAAVINVDMPGAPRAMSTSGDDTATDFLKALRERLRAYELDADIGRLSGDSSDFAPFLDTGVCTIGLWGDIGPGTANYHNIGDKYEGVDRRGTVQSAAVLGVLVRQLADYSGRISATRVASR